MRSFLLKTGRWFRALPTWLEEWDLCFHHEVIYYLDAHWDGHISPTQRPDLLFPYAISLFQSHSIMTQQKYFFKKTSKSKHVSQSAAVSGLLVCAHSYRTISEWSSHSTPLNTIILSFYTSCVPQPPIFPIKIQRYSHWVASPFLFPIKRRWANRRGRNETVYVRILVINILYITIHTYTLWSRG